MTTRPLRPARRCGTTAPEADLADAPHDPALLDAARRGDADALATLYDRHAPRLLAIARSLLGDDAEDVVHDVFLSAWHDAARFDPARGSVRTWLAVRLRSRCLDRLRRRATRARKEDDVPLPAAHATLDPAMLDAARLDAALARLPGPQAQAVRLRYLDGLSSQEAADAAGCPLGTLKSRLREGLRALRAEFDPTAGQEAT